MKFIYLYHLVCFQLLATGIMSAQPAYDFQKLKQEDLGRGFVAVREDPQTVHLSWRYLISDPTEIAFDLYRNGGKVNHEPLKNATFFSDRNATDKELNYELHIINQQEQGSKKEAQQKVEVNQPYGYINIPLNIPPDGVTPSGQHYSYHANDASVGDVDGDGTVDGTGVVIGDPDADHRNNKGRILSGPEYMTLFEGETGKALQTIDYIPARGSSESWGDDRANRSDRFLACVAYLDGEYPSVVMCRGYYTRTVLAAFDWRNGELTNRWVFDSDEPGNEKYAGQGNHNLRVGDVDGDGRDEIVYGSCTIDDDGKGLYSTEMGHGDAMHLTVFDPSSRKLQVWDCHENKRDGSSFRDAATGEVLFQVKSNSDVGRALAADIDPTSRGVEMWSLASGGIRNMKGEVINPSIRGITVNMACWWDGDLSRELLNGTEISKYNPETGVADLLFHCNECVQNNGTKSTPVLTADIVGDWREEVILRTRDNQNLRIYVSPHETSYRFHTLMQDPVYRISVATQNVAYNQPTQPGFYFGSDLEKVFHDNEIETSSDSITLQTAMPYDSYRWSNGKSTPTITIHREEALPGNSIRMELEVTYRGYRLKDFVTITFLNN